MKIPDRILHKKNLVCLCVDEKMEQDLSGRIYHAYQENEIPFHTVLEVVEALEDVCELTRYPQSNVYIRQFVKAKEMVAEQAERKMPNEQLAAYRGKLATFLIAVGSRENASWQGEIFWVETDKIQTFHSEMELIASIYSVK